MTPNEAILFEHVKKAVLYHTDGSGRVTMSSLSRFAQESAGYHASQLGFGFADLAALGMAWVLREQTLQVLRYPALDENVRILTWPTRAERILCHRDFKIVDAAGSVVALGTTAWFGLDLASRRPRKAESFFRVELEHAPGPVFVAALPELEAPLEIAGTTCREVQPSDLDALGHMSNLRYLDWASDHVTRCGIDRLRITMLRIRYVREVMAGEMLEIRHAVRRDGAVLIEMRRVEDGAGVCLVRLQLGEEE